MQLKNAAYPTCEQPPRIRCRHEEIPPKVASIKVSIKMISPESISFYPLGRSNLRHVVPSTVSILSFEEKDRKSEER